MALKKQKSSLTESDIQIKVSQYIKEKYPDVIFTFDASGLRLPIGYAMKIKKMRSSNGIPDLLVFEPKGGYNGLFIELKKDGVKIYKKDYTFTSEHYEEQFNVIEALKDKGYCAMFAFGLDEAKAIIDFYLDDSIPDYDIERTFAL